MLSLVIYRDSANPHLLQHLIRSGFFIFINWTVITWDHTWSWFAFPWFVRNLSSSYVSVIRDSFEMTIYVFLFSEPQFFFSSENSGNNAYLMGFNCIMYAVHLVQFLSHSRSWIELVYFFPSASEVIVWSSHTFLGPFPPSFCSLSVPPLPLPPSLPFASRTHSPSLTSQLCVWGCITHMGHPEN